MDKILKEIPQVVCEQVTPHKRIIRIISPIHSERESSQSELEVKSSIKTPPAKEQPVIESDNQTQIQK